MLRKICVCQNTTCQNKGSKGVLHRIQNVYNERFTSVYPNLQIIEWDCNGDCEQGPVVQVNDSILLREMDNQRAQQLLEDPEAVLEQVIHVHDQDRDIFERIISGELY